MYECVLGFSWADLDPTFSAMNAGICLGLYVAGGGIGWWNPRLGNFLSGMGWLSYFVLSFMSSVPHGRFGSYFVEWAPEFLFLLAPAFWHLYACVKDDPACTGRAKSTGATGRLASRSVRAGDPPSLTS